MHPRAASPGRPPDTGGSPNYGEDVESQVPGRVRERVEEFEDAWIGGVGLFLTGV